jgi:hypothetical protein
MLGNLNKNAFLKIFGGAKIEFNGKIPIKTKGSGIRNWPGLMGS